MEGVNLLCHMIAICISQIFTHPLSPKPVVGATSLLLALWDKLWFVKQITSFCEHQVHLSPRQSPGSEEVWQSWCTAQMAEGRWVDLSPRRHQAGP